MTGDPQTPQTANAPTPSKSNDTGGEVGNGLTADRHKWVHETFGINPLDYGSQPEQSAHLARLMHGMAGIRWRM